MKKMDPIFYFISSYLSFFFLDFFFNFPTSTSTYFKRNQMKWNEKIKQNQNRFNTILLLICIIKKIKKKAFVFTFMLLFLLILNFTFFYCTSNLIRYRLDYFYRSNIYRRKSIKTLKILIIFSMLFKQFDYFDFSLSLLYVFERY